MEGNLDKVLNKSSEACWASFCDELLMLVEMGSADMTDAISYKDAAVRRPVYM